MISDLSESDLASMLPNATPTDITIGVGDTIIIRLHRQKSRARKAVVTTIMAVDHSILTSLQPTKDFKGYVIVKFEDGTENFVWPSKDWIYTLGWVTNWAGDSAPAASLTPQVKVSPRIQRLVASKKDTTIP